MLLLDEDQVSLTATSLISPLQPYQLHADLSRNPPASWDYCGKDDTRIGPTKEHGIRPSPLKDKAFTEEEKDQLETTAIDAMLNGADHEWFRETPERRKYFRGTGFQVKQHVSKLQQPSGRPTGMKVYYFHGGTGLGKTAIIKMVAHKARIHIWEINDGCPAGKWFDGFIPGFHKWVLWDDFDGFANFRQFIKIMDVYERRVGQKGGGTILKYVEAMFITADVQPAALKWGTSEDDSKRRFLQAHEQDQFDRRIHHLFEFQPGAVNRPPFPWLPEEKRVEEEMLENRAMVHPRYADREYGPQLPSQAWVSSQASQYRVAQGSEQDQVAVQALPAPPASQAAVRVERPPLPSNSSSSPQTYDEPFPLLQDLISRLQEESHQGHVHMEPMDQVLAGMLDEEILQQGVVQAPSFPLTPRVPLLEEPEF